MTKRYSKKDLKAMAQNEIMSAIQCAFSGPCISDELRAAMDAQMARVEKLFGYEVGSYRRGE